MKMNMAFSKKIWTRSTSRPNYTTIGIYPKNVPSFHKNTCSTILLVALFIVARNWKQHSCPLAEEYIKKVWYVCTMM